MACWALRHGDKVVATPRNPAALQGFVSQYSNPLLMLRLDVDTPAEIAAAFRKANAALVHFVVVLNSASYVVAGEIEGTPRARQV
ncbi:hypothetical protein BD310DRAFT_98419 [Dichomitus squalens]|uniref:Ketoreductase (KR) domain-containing protein n=1 Tax=Dichomitus squalens TaxID=114155 RepID=A0A4Q9PJK6_9APHY|nr:hypothetical protein BD310DRAFT_98419 [Dichomitus squalens]